MLQAELFIKIDGVEGSSSDEGYKGWIQIDTYHNGSRNYIDVDNGNGQTTSTGVNFDPVGFRKSLDTATAELFTKVNEGKKIDTITIVEVRKQQGKAIEQMRWEYKGCYMTAFDYSAESEEYNFMFSTVQLLTNVQGANGKVTKKGPVGWDRVKNTIL